MPFRRKMLKTKMRVYLMKTENDEFARSLYYSSLAVIITTSIWILLMALDESVTGTDSIESKISAIKNSGLLFYINYFNASLITVFTTVFFSICYLVVKNLNSKYAITGIIFLPIYSAGNLVSYLSQILVVPGIIDLFETSKNPGVQKLFLELMIHTFPGSMIEMLNSFSYAVLGIPSILFAVVLFRNYEKTKTGSFLLGISGLLSLLSFIGIAAGIKDAAVLSIIGGAIFLIGMIFLSFRFRKRT